MSCCAAPFTVDMSGTASVWGEGSLDNKFTVWTTTNPTRMADSESFSDNSTDPNFLSNPATMKLRMHRLIDLFANKRLDFHEQYRYVRTCSPGGSSRLCQELFLNL